MFLRWYGHAGRTYFVQISDPNDHLRKWIWAPIIETGNDEDISYEVDGTADKGFFRLWFTDEPTADPDGGDFDGDGLSNLAEVLTHQTNPLKVDTDGDGLLDGWEIANSLDPNDDGTTNVNNGGSGDPDNDGLTNAEEQDLGTDPNDADSDDDGITDGGENDQGTDPNDPEDTPDAEWFILTGDLDEDEVKTRNRTVNIPAGQNCLVVVAVASEEYPYFTGDASEFNDTLSWSVTPSGGQALVGNLDVNSRHQQWEEAELDGIAIQGFSPAHIEACRIFSATENDALDIPMMLSATNIGDGILPSTVMVGVFPFKIERDEDVVDSNWNPVTGQLAKALPGERINLRVDTSNFPEDFTVDGFEWVLPGKVFKDYAVTANKGELVDLEAADLNQQSVGFHFTTDGLKDIRVKFNVDGTAVEAKVEIKVEKPTSTFTTDKGVVRLGAGPLGIHALGFMGANNPLYGVKYIASVTTPDGWTDGKFVYSQLIKSKREFTNPPSGNVTVLGDGVTWKHDGPFPYGTAAATFTADGVTPGIHGDSPSEAADSVFRSTIEISESFQTYLMFRPAGTASRHVPLRKINWNWGGKATSADNWTAVTDPVSAVDAEGAETDQHPEWDDNAENDEEQDAN
jgi:hypothetical protein